MLHQKNRDWFRNATIYQIYPRSFRDANGDGIGDLRGIIEKLDYLADLGVDAVWICPFFASPNDDNGYDISDYQAIHPDFGTMDDFDELLAGLHRRGIRLILDMVLNHCSDEHEWFVQARSSRQSPFRDWFHWAKPGPDGGPPNAWGAAFSGSAWEAVRDPDGSTEYYLHMFSKKQPDLNWENPDLRQAIYRMMRWWCAKGVDGFRLDVINLVSKTPGYPEGPRMPGSPWTSAFLATANGPRIHEFLREMNREVFEPYGVVTVGEAPGVSVAIAREYTAPDRRELDMVFQFEMMGLDEGPMGKFDLRPCQPERIAETCRKWQDGLAGQGWNSLYWNNHDQPRPVSRFGDPNGTNRELSGKALAAFLFLQQGTAFVYQGEEIGMTNVPWRDATELRDIESLNFIREASTSPDWTKEKIWAGICAKGRDNARTPFCWAPEHNAGFSAGLPWLRVHPDYPTVNAACSMARPDSLWCFYRDLIRFRREEPLIAHGRIEFVDTPDRELLLYRRWDEAGRELWVGTHLAGKESRLLGNGPWLACGGAGDTTRPVFANYPRIDEPGLWRPWELRVWRGPQHP